MFLKIRKHAWMGILPLLAAGLLFLPSVSPAAVREVTLFPDSARVEETVKIDLQSADANKNQVILVLPSQADPESLTVSPSSAGRIKIDDIRIKSIARIDENRIAQLRTQLKKNPERKKGAHGPAQSPGHPDSVLAGADQGKNQNGDRGGHAGFGHRQKQPQNIF